MTSDYENISHEERIRLARHVTWVGSAVNAALSVLKIIAGILGHSAAMIADGIHSISDLITDIVVVVFIGITGRGKNEHYRYGHGKFETFATFIISVALAIVAIGIFWSGAKAIYGSFHGETLERPGLIALCMAAASIIAKELLYHYTAHVGNILKSSAVIANAWHHRSDSLSSIATLIGIGGAMYLGDKWRILDPIASVVVSFFVMIVAYRIAMPSIRQLLEASLPEETEHQIENIISSTEGVKRFHHLKTRQNGNDYIIDFHIKVNPNITIVEAHDIASQVEARLRDAFGEDTQTSVHIEPYSQSK